MHEPIPFNRPYLTGDEGKYIAESLASRKLSGNGPFAQRCDRFFEARFGIHKALLTPSCTDALEMTALLMDLKPGDEVILPSYTFVSTANAYLLRGAKLIFADSETNTPNIDVVLLESLITEKTRAIVVVHYGGMACDMNALIDLTQKYGLFLIEDAAHAIDAYYHGQSLGTFGQMSTFSFHETKNISCGEGGLLAINDPSLAARAEIIREKGTNRQAFFRGEVDKYTWQDIGSSFLAADYVAAFLWAQLENLETIQSRRLEIWRRYESLLAPLAEQGLFQLTQLPAGSTHNAHLFYILCRDIDQRSAWMAALKADGISTAYHYLPLHESPFYSQYHDQQRSLPNVTRYADCLLRLPLYADLTLSQVERVAESLKKAVGCYV